MNKIQSFASKHVLSFAAGDAFPPGMVGYSRIYISGEERYVANFLDHAGICNQGVGLRDDG
jgi:hypothetical protein